MPSKPGQRKRRPLVWDDVQRKVLGLVFEGRWSPEKIAEDCEISARTARDWIAHPEFQAKLKDMREHLLETCDELGIAYVRKEQRVAALSQMAEQLRTQYEEKPWLLERRPVGRDQETGELLIMEQEAVNEAAAAQTKGYLADIAAEMGDRKRVTELTGKNGGPIEVGYARERLAARLNALAERRGSRGPAEQSE